MLEKLDKNKNDEKNLFSFFYKNIFNVIVY